MLSQKKRPDDLTQEKPKPVIMIIGPPFMCDASNAHQLLANCPTNDSVREPNRNVLLIRRHKINYFTMNHFCAKNMPLRFYVYP